MEEITKKQLDQIISLCNKTHEFLSCDQCRIRTCELQNEHDQFFLQKINPFFYLNWFDVRYFITSLIQTNQNKFNKIFTDESKSIIEFNGKICITFDLTKGYVINKKLNCCSNQYETLEQLFDHFVSSDHMNHLMIYEPEYFELIVIYIIKTYLSIEYYEYTYDFQTIHQLLKFIKKEISSSNMNNTSVLHLFIHFFGIFDIDKDLLNSLSIGRLTNNNHYIKHSLMWNMNKIKNKYKMITG